MRFEAQPWNAIRLLLEIVDTGVGQTGKTVTGTVRRTSNGQYLQSGGGWGASPSSLSFSQASATDQPGLYFYDPTVADLSTTDGKYIVKITESTYNVLEYVLITPVLSGDDQRRMYGLRQENMRFIPSAWDSTTKQPTAGTVYLYPSTSAYDADTTPNGTGAMASWSISALFSAGQLSHYGSKRLT